MEIDFDRLSDANLVNAYGLLLSELRKRKIIPVSLYIKDLNDDEY
jgi:hypothetical protein